MKFCKSLQELISVADPSWTGYWINYKMLKKVIKALPAMETMEDTSLQERHLFSEVFGTDRPMDEPASPPPSLRTAAHDGSFQRLCLAKSPREVYFFKLLYAEFRKVTEFFARVLSELLEREARIRSDESAPSDRLSPMSPGDMDRDKPHAGSGPASAKTIYSLYKDLLLLETYAIVSFCGFSKILKKKDKCTGVPTRAAFMRTFVQRANFANYPALLEMIQRCQGAYREAARRTAAGPLLDDQRLFLDMILQMNLDAAGVAVQEGGGHPLPFATAAGLGDPVAALPATLRFHDGEVAAAQHAHDNDEDEDDDDEEEEEEEEDDEDEHDGLPLPVRLHAASQMERPTKRLKL